MTAKTEKILNDCDRLVGMVDILIQEQPERRDLLLLAREDVCRAAAYIRHDRMDEAYGYLKAAKAYILEVAA